MRCRVQLAGTAECSEGQWETERQRETNRVKKQIILSSKGVYYKELTMGNASVGCSVDGWDAPSHRFPILLMH